jgi:cyclopropane-fatty-acyl-phospholipid synthase
MSMFLLDAALRRLVTNGTLILTEASGRQRTYGTKTAGWPDLGLRLHDSRVPGTIARNPTLGMAECFMDGRLSIENGDIMDFVGFIRRNNPWEKGGDLDNLNLFDKLRVAISARLDQRNQRLSSRRNVAHHYDLDDRLYDLFLDPARQYSCAYWDDGVTTLDEAQLAKMEHIAAKLNLQPGMRVLDIGCGWGGLALHLHKISGASIHGISLSKEQIGYAQAWAQREGVADKVTFALTDYRDEPGPYDRIVSVGYWWQ